MNTHSMSISIAFFFAIIFTPLAADAADERSFQIQQLLTTLSDEHAVDPPLTVARCRSLLEISDVILLSEGDRRLISICDAAVLQLSPNKFTSEYPYSDDNSVAEGDDEPLGNDFFDFFDYESWWNV